MRCRMSHVLLVMVVLSFVVGCANKESELRNVAPNVITQAMNERYAMIGSKVSKVEVIGVSVDGNNGTVKATVTCEIPKRLQGTITQPSETHDFMFKRYDTGWVVESFK